MDLDINYSYHWNEVEGDGVYTATGVAANQTREGDQLALGGIKQEIAKKLYDERGIVLYESGTNVQINCGASGLRKGPSLGKLEGHAALNIDGNFTLDVYEAGEPCP